MELGGTVSETEDTNEGAQRQPNEINENVVSPTPPATQVIEPQIPISPACVKVEEETQEVRKRKNQSDVWLHFEKMKNHDGTPMMKPKAKCKYCPQTYACDSRINGTTSLRTHMMYQCKKCPAYVPNKKQKHLSFDPVAEGGNLRTRSFDADKSNLELARMIVRDELPFSFVENEGFHAFMRVTQPLFVIPSRRKVCKDIWKMYLSEKQRMKEYFARTKTRVSLTTDTWTSVQNINYLVLTAHFIDESWTLQKRIINFCVIPDHKGKTIGALVESCVMDWGLERIFSIVVDNASTNKVALDYMKEKIKNWGYLVLRGSFLHSRCCHILNLIVKDGMQELDDSIEAIRNAVKYIRSSPARLDKFRKCAAMEKIDHKAGVVPMDVCTRWNSTYFMLDVAVKYNKAFSRLEDEDHLYEGYFLERVGGKKRVGPPMREDWEKAATLVKFLKIFYDATLSFSGTKVVTSNQPIQWMCTIVDQFDSCLKSTDSMMVRVGLAMKEKFEKYWNEDLNVALVLAVVLDPRYKMLYLEFFFPRMFKNTTRVRSTAEEEKNIVKVMVREKVDEVIDKLKTMYLEYSSSDTMVFQAHGEEAVPVEESDLGEDDSHAISMIQFMKLRKQNSVVEIKDEVDKFLNEASEDPANKNFKLLDWWKENAPRYPILSKIAKDIFAVPASTVASESAFSLGSRVVDPYRASLTTKMVECLVCLSDWLRGGSFSLYKEPTKSELELFAELEKLESESMVNQDGKA